MNDNQTQYLCCKCENDLAVELHEPVFGAGDKKICEKYDIQFPVCRTCHEWAHGRDRKFENKSEKEKRKTEQAIFFFNLVDLRYENIPILFENSKANTKYFLFIQKRFIGFLGRYEQ